MSAHAFLPPSSAFRWVVCALSAALEAAYPETEPSPETLEGTAAHWAAEQLVRGAPATVGQQAPNGTAITQEMLEAAELVRDDLVATLGPSLPGLVIEQRVQIPRVHPSQNWGTPDYRAWSRMSNGNLCLHVWDYKFGHRIVEAFENWQLIDYAAGCLDEAGIDGLQDQTVIVDLRVIQPRAPHRDGPVRYWRTVASDLRGYVNRLRHAAELATGAEPPARPEVVACRDCRGRHACEALQREAAHAADKGRHYAPLDLNAHALGLELRALTRARGLLDARVSGLQEEAEARMRKGERVPFWMFEQTPGRLNWTRPAAEVIATGDMLGLKLAKPVEPITPTQAKKAGFPETLIAQYASRGAGALQLVEDDGAKARLTFSSSIA